MVKKKELILGLISIFLILSMVSTANATTADKPAAFGVGTFLHEHEGEQCNHFFTFNIVNGEQSDSWLYNPNGHFFMICKHDNVIHMIAKSDEIQRFKVMEVQGGLKAIFEGLATVKHMDADWEGGWVFMVEAFDYDGTGEDFIHIMFIDPDGMEHHMEGTLTSGNIVIKK